MAASELTTQGCYMDEFTQGAPIEPTANTIEQNSPELGENNTTSNDTTTEPFEGLSQGQALYKLVHDGQEEEVDLQTLLKLASHGKGADKRMSDAGRLKADAQKLIDMIRNDPIAARKELEEGFNEKDFLVNRLAKLMEESAMTPEQKQQRQDMQELQELRAKKKLEQDEINNSKLKETMNVEIKKLDEEFAAAFAEAKLPKTEYARRRLAAVMLQAQDNGQNIPTVQLAKLVADEIRQEQKESWLSLPDDEAFEALLGSELLTRAQKISLKKIKSPGNPVKPNVVKRDDTPRMKPKTAEDFLGDLGMF